MEARRIGYEPLVRDGVSLSAGERVTLTLSMRPAPFRLAEVTVTPGSFSFLDAGPASRQTVLRIDIETAPFSEDRFRALSRLPGLSSGDYGAHFSVRGGRHDETLILLDGLDVYEPFHLKNFNEGALSIIDVETIDGVELLIGCQLPPVPQLVRHHRVHLHTGWPFTDEIGVPVRQKSERWISRSGPTRSMVAGSRCTFA